jgi:hypothetical protein
MKFSFTLVTRSRTVGRTPWKGDQLVARPLLVHNTNINIHALSGIRTHGPGVHASEDSSCFRPLGYRERRQNTLEESRQSCQYYEKVRVGGHIELSNDNPISEKFRNENDVIYEVDAFVNVVLSKV